MNKQDRVVDPENDKPEWRRYCYLKVGRWQWFRSGCCRWGFHQWLIWWPHYSWGRQTSPPWMSTKNWLEHGERDLSEEETSQRNVAVPLSKLTLASLLNNQARLRQKLFIDTKHFVLEGHLRYSRPTSIFYLLSRWTQFFCFVCCRCVRVMTQSDESLERNYFGADHATSGRAAVHLRRK